MVDSSYNEIESVSSSPGVQKRPLASEYNFESMKRVLAEPTEATKREAREKQMQIGRAFRETAFEDLVRRTEPKHDVIQNKLNEIFTALSAERQISCGIQAGSLLGANGGLNGPLIDGGKQLGGGGGGGQRPIYENNFPELFFY